LPCKGICDNYLFSRRPIRYDLGAKRCDSCRVAILYVGEYCPCCHNLLKIRPKNFPYRKDIAESRSKKHSEHLKKQNEIKEKKKQDQEKQKLTAIKNKNEGKKKKNDSKAKSEKFQKKYEEFVNRYKINEK